MYTKYNYMYMSTIEILLLYHTLVQVSYSYTSMYTKYNYMYHTLTQVCVLNIITIEILLLYHTKI